MTTIESLDRVRRRMLWAVVVTSLLWLLPQITLVGGADDLPATWRVPLVVATLFGAGAWMFFMWRMRRFNRRLRADPATRDRLEDERVREVRREAIYRSWFVIVVTLGLGVALSALVSVPSQPLMLVLLLLAVDAPIVFFLVLDRG